MTSPGFDRVAPEYRRLWTETTAGEVQRAAVWRRVGALFPRGSRVLDLGCGTGDDAVWLRSRGVSVAGVDASAEMIRIARVRGVEARVCRAENIADLNESFDGVLSNFGVLNCVERPEHLRPPLARSVKPGGWLAVCLMSRVCLWETVWYSIHGQFARAVRRWSGEATSSVVPRVFYPTVPRIRRAFAPEFTLQESHGIGVAIPPSYVNGLSALTVQRLGRIDESIASLPLIRALGDHRLLIFQRRSEPC